MNKKQGILILFMMLFPTISFAGPIEELREAVEVWVVNLSGIALLVSGAVWALGDLVHISFFEHLVHKYKLGLIAAVIFFAVCYTLDDYVAEFATRVARPFAGI